MSSASWQKRLSKALRPLRQVNPPTRVALLGVGQELRGDDAAGLLVARGLKALLPNSSELMVVEAGPAPENFTGPLRRFSPGLILLIDAARMGEPPGTVQFLDLAEVVGVTSSTHTLPLSVMGGFMSDELGCPVALLGIQPASLDFDTSVTPLVERAINQVVSELVSLLS